MRTRMKEEVRIPAEIKRVVLCGFMGAGKTTTGRLLAARLGWRFQDVDLVIENETGRKISEIFAQFGEPHFRDLEHKTICRLLEETGIVLALGGGAVEHAGTRERLLSSPDTFFVHLYVSMETVVRRCGGTESIRPVFNDRARLQQRYDNRLPLYQQAHLTIATNDISAGEVAERLARMIEGVTQSAGTRD